MRFQFLGWFVAATIILSSGLSFVRRAQVLVIGLVGAVCLFAVAGALRNAEESTAELEQSALGKVRLCRGCQHARWLCASPAGLS
jgi:hypothetical protein